MIKKLTMPVNWMDVTPLSFNSLLLLEQVQLSWFPGWLPKPELGVALRANPVVEWYFRHKCPSLNDWLDKVLAEASASATPESVRQAEIAVMRSITDLLVFVVDPAVYDAQPFLNWDSGELTSLLDFTDKVVIDVGAGTGRLALTVALQARTVYAVEPVGNLRAFLKAKARDQGLKNVFAVDGLITDIPFPDGFADVTMAGHTFGDDPEEEYLELMRVTRPAGMIILCPGNKDLDNERHSFLVARGFRWSCFEEPRDGMMRKYWKIKEPALGPNPRPLPPRSAPEGGKGRGASALLPLRSGGRQLAGAASSRHRLCQRRESLAGAGPFVKISGYPMTKLVALVPMRHHSQRVPGKNYRPLAGKPLYQHVIETLLACPEIGQIVVDTDSQPVMDGLRRDFPQVIVLPRPAELCGDAVSMNDVLLYDTSKVEAEFYLQTHSTNPLLRPETVSQAIQAFLADYPAHDSLFSVTRLQTRLYDQNGRALNHDPNVLIQTQDLPPVYEENSCLYIFTRENLLRRRNRLGERPLMYAIDAAEAWDIDEELDFAIADFLLQRIQGETKKDE